MRALGIQLVQQCAALLHDLSNFALKKAFIPKWVAQLSGRLNHISDDRNNRSEKKMFNYEDEKLLLDLA